MHPSVKTIYNLKNNKKNHQKNHYDDGGSIIVLALKYLEESPFLLYMNV